MKRQAGSGSILGVAIIAAVLATLILLIPLYGVIDTRQRLTQAADASALAAADTAIGIQAGVPCEAARSVADANGAALAACQLDGPVATVKVTARRFGFPVSATATAGPPGTGR